jgi:hypothetical protein
VVGDGDVEGSLQLREGKKTVKRGGIEEENGRRRRSSIEEEGGGGGSILVASCVDNGGEVEELSTTSLCQNRGRNGGGGGLVHGARVRKERGDPTAWARRVEEGGPAADNTWRQRRRAVDAGESHRETVGPEWWAGVGRPTRNNMVFHLFKIIQKGLN